MITFASDIGGTHCRMALFEGPELIRLEVMPTDPKTDFLTYARRFLRDTAPSAAGIAVAGPVRRGLFARVRRLRFPQRSARYPGETSVHT